MSWKGHNLSGLKVQRHILVEESLVLKVWGCKCIFELKRAWFEWIEGPKVPLERGKNYLNGLRVQRCIWVQEDYIWVGWGCKNIFESKRVHLNSKGFDSNRLRVQIHIWEQNGIVWMNLGAKKYHLNGLRCKDMF